MAKKPAQVKVGFQEHGSPGIDINYGFISEAYHADLTWPTVQPLFSRLRRSDPEVTIVRNIFLTFARDLKLSWSVPQEFAEDRSVQDAIEFGNSVLEDLEGGPERFIETLVSHVPFMGWGWWEAIPAVRDPNWKPPGDIPWRSMFDDKKIGFRSFAWRDSSSFKNWDDDDKSGRIKGMVQQDPPNPDINIPLDRSIHLTYGDSNNPEGLSPLEALWRLERIKYGLEVVQGMGMEHAAGFLKIMSENEKLSPDDQSIIKKVARAVMTAQAGNYLALPKGLTAELMDSGFSAAPSILEAIRYYGILKLMILMAQWVALSAISGSGSYSAMETATDMFITFFNAMMKGFIDQTDRQIGPRLFNQYNDFSKLPVRPRLHISEVDKSIKLTDLGQFLQAFTLVSEIYEDDVEAIRKRSGFLPEQPSGDVVTPQRTEEEPVGDLSHFSHTGEVVERMCPLCGNSQAFKYPDHKGLLVCTKCEKTYDPEVE